MLSAFYRLCLRNCFLSRFDRCGGWPPPTWAAFEGCWTFKALWAFTLWAFTLWAFTAAIWAFKFRTFTAFLKVAA